MINNHWLSSLTLTTPPTDDDVDGISKAHHYDRHPDSLAVEMCAFDVIFVKNDWLGVPFLKSGLFKWAFSVWLGHYFVHVQKCKIFF